LYEVGLRRSFRARHIMPGREGPEGKLHEHEYRIDVVVERAALDGRGMVCDLDALDACLRGIVEGVEGRRLDEIPGLGNIAGVTVETFARWAHAEILEALGEQAGGAVSVRMWESPFAFGGYRATSSE
jgi:6-pyruvoyltetrahydropterin/6-carboxytetrahydropterin synthase